MQIQLSNKERMFLEDGKIQEEICVQKYENYAELAQDTELKQLFNRLAGEEQHHYDMINQLLQGQQPNLSHNQQAQKATMQNNFKGTVKNKSDKTLCIDALSTEKYVSGTYDIDVFESANPIVRQAMQHIQQDEQKHGEDLFNYMSTHGMYQVK